LDLFQDRAKFQFQANGILILLQKGRLPLWFLRLKKMPLPEFFRRGSSQRTMPGLFLRLSTSAMLIGWPDVGTPP
jgi:hypothetical protein